MAPSLAGQVRARFIDDEAAADIEDEYDDDDDEGDESERDDGREEDERGVSGKGKGKQRQ